MHANTSTAATPPAASKQEIPADVLPLMESAREYVRAQKMNPVEKREEVSALLDRITNLPSAFDGGLEPHEKTTRECRRRELWAQFHAFRELETEDNLTPERRAYWRSQAHERMPDWEQYSFAAGLVRELETENLGLEEPSRTCKALCERSDERGEEVTRALSYALSGEQIALLGRFLARGYRRKRFRLERKVRWGRLLLIDATVRAPYCRFPFSHYCERAMTLLEIKALLAIWDTKFLVERRDGCSVVVGDGFEIHPVEARS